LPSWRKVFRYGDRRHISKGRRGVLEEVAMTSHRLPFENRWTNNANAQQWNSELNHLGVANVRAMFVDHEIRHPNRRNVLQDIPAGFVRDWLAFQDRRVARQQTLWRATVIALSFVAATAAVLGVLRT
jgi:hypothetical protein